MATILYSVWIQIFVLCLLSWAFSSKYNIYKQARVIIILSQKSD